MSRRTNPTLVGLFVVGALALAVGVVLVVGSGKLFEKSYPCVLYFDGSVNGLRVGAPVKFKGVEIGRVESIRLPVAQNRDDPPIEVVIALDASQMDTSGPPSEIAQTAIERGLRVQLEADSFVTGVLYVSFVFAPDTPVNLRHLREDLPELPTVPTPMERLQDSANQIIAQLQRIDLARTVDEIGALVGSLRKVIESENVKATFDDMRAIAQELRQAVTGLDGKLEQTVDSVHTLATRVDSVGAKLEGGIGDAQQSLVAARKLIENVDTRSTPLLDSLKQTSDSLTRVAAALETSLTKANGILDPDAPIAVQLHGTLSELQGTARATRELIEFLERNPAALLRGKYPGED